MRGFVSVPSYQTRQKSSQISSETVPPWLSSTADQECEMKVSRSSVERCFRNPYLGSLSNPGCSRDDSSWSEILVANNL